jgi:CRISPR-associated protein Csb2
VAPSPWRVLRALIATWHLKNRDAFDYDTLCSLITALAEKPPLYWLPPASLGHTRHYMPYLEGSKVRTTKVFDTFVHLAAGEPIRIFWDVALTPEQERALSLLFENLGYLVRPRGEPGRSPTRGRRGSRAAKCPAACRTRASAR